MTARANPQIGKVLATVKGARAEYKLTGAEMYVRAVVTSDRKKNPPSFKGQHEQAWTQPVGWRKWLQSCVFETPGRANKGHRP